ncbi:MAG: response regulator [bacterium]|nr:response regulator [bacterium]
MAGYKILLVDDSRAALYMIETMLRDINMLIEDISTAGNGVEALIFLEKQKVDLIFTDIIMPQMDGFTLIDRLKKSRFAGIPVIPVTSLGAQKDLDKVKARGIKRFITKPFTREQLEGALSHALKITFS